LVNYNAALWTLLAKTGLWWRLGIVNSLRYNAKAHQSYVR